jgi:hypothetical protein
MSSRSSVSGLLWLWLDGSPWGPFCSSSTMINTSFGYGTTVLDLGTAHHHAPSMLIADADCYIFQHCFLDSLSTEGPQKD